MASHTLPALSTLWDRLPDSFFLKGHRASLGPYLQGSSVAPVGRMHLKRLHLFLPGTSTHVGQFAASVAFQDIHEKWILASNPHEGEGMVSMEGNVWCMFLFVFSTRAQTGSSPELLGDFYMGLAQAQSFSPTSLRSGLTRCPKGNWLSGPAHLFLWTWCHFLALPDL